QVEAKLVESVQKTGVMPDFGILGSKYIFRALSEAGHSDLAFKMLCQDAHPSFGNWIKRGATTLWEDWNEGDSRNHIMFGDFSAWCYQYLGGIRLDANVSAIAQKVDPQAVAFKSFIIRPDPVDGLEWFKAEHDSAYGMIRSSWQKEGEKFVLEVEVPVNTTATVFLPVKPGTEGVESEVEPMATDGDRVAFKVGSGRYRFAAPLSRLSSPGH
ncbi:MAG: alpha-L-rhamnosidase C-terminal domain-containing protein, partial [Kiritimatiellae bacterium]|nr:alpha-L-rhamnosidase C-terminal domain-containing protein [Kiritimatiellia bacterium]